MTTVAPKQRRTQEERAAQTRAKILDATVESLIDDGYAATTTTAVQKRAGVSRGALMHHFPSKQDLLLDAVSHLARQRGDWVLAKAETIDRSADRTHATMTLLWGAMNGPLFAAATELWVAARSDDDLRKALIASERRLGSGARQVFADLLGAGDDDPAFRQAFDYVLQVFRGAALTTIVRDDVRWELQLVATTAHVFNELYDAPHKENQL